MSDSGSGAPAAEPPAWLAIWRCGAATSGLEPLRVVRPVGGSGPDMAAAGGVHILLDGVLDNEAALREQLGEYREPPGGPAALVLLAYRRWGAGGLGRLRGAFALLIGDAGRDLLLAARDPLGVYPLFYVESADGLLFSTAIDTLLAQPGVSREINRPALADHLTRRWTRPAETYYAAVRRVPRSHTLLGERGRLRTERSWSVLPPGPLRWASEPEVRQFGPLLTQAVTRAQGGRTAGVWLSGGLDSTSVAALATQTSRRAGLPAPLALSLVLQHPDCNEEPVQRRVAVELGLAQELLPVGPTGGSEGILAGALAMSAGWAMPLLNCFLPAFYTLARRARQRGCGVILTGGGGDEVLGVGPMYAADLLRAGDVVGLVRFCNVFLRSYATSRRTLLRYLLWTDGARLVLASGVAAAQRRFAPGVYRQRRAAAAAGSPPAWLLPDPELRRAVDARVGDAPPAQAAEGFYEGAARRELDDTFVEMEMEEHFALGRRLDLAVRQPFWDADLLALLYRAPPAWLNQGGYTKGLLRGPLARRFPGLGFERQRKVDATGLFEQLVFEQSAAAWHALGGVRSLADLGIVDPKALGTALRPFLAGADSGGAFRFWDIVRLEAWLRPRLA